MGIFDLLGLGGSDKKIHSRDFYKALWQISELSPKEKAYISEAFKDCLKDGLSKFEIQKICSGLMHKPGDPLEPFEVEKIREKLLKHFE